MFRRRLRVRVQEDRGEAVVVLRRRWQVSLGGIVVGAVRLDREDADERLAELRMRAADMARQLNGLEDA